MFVNKRSELTQIATNFQNNGMRVFRVRTLCRCKKIGQGNQRDGVIVLDGDRLVMEIVRCRNCV